MIDPVKFAMAREQARLAGSGFTPFGLRRDHYVIPDFPAYEQAFVQYAPLVKSMVSDAQAMLLQTHTVEIKRKTLADQLQHVETQCQILETEQAAGAMETQKVEAVVSAIDAKINQHEKQIEAKRAELALARLDFNGLDIIVTVAEVIGAVVAVVGAVYTGGTSVMAFTGLLTAAQDKWKALKPDPVTGEPTYNDKPLAEFVTWTDKDGKFSPQVTPEAKALAGGLKDVIKAGKAGVSATLDLIDKGRVLAELTTYGSGRRMPRLQGRVFFGFSSDAANSARGTMVISFSLTSIRSMRWRR